MGGTIYGKKNKPVEKTEVEEAPPPTPQSGDTFTPVLEDGDLTNWGIC